MNSIKYIIIFLWFISGVDAQEMEIGMFHVYKVTKLRFKSSDAFTLGAGIPKAKEFILDKRGSKIEIYADGSLLGVFDSLNFKMPLNHLIEIKPLSPRIRSKNISGPIRVKVQGDRIVTVNTVSLEDYLAGVIRAEGGMYKPLEYYKAQAVISRTYVLSHQHRHVEDGFHLCDNVHCQVYFGVVNVPEIQLACLSTQDEIIIDKNYNLITASFYSNSGGETVNSEDVWVKPLPYLRAKEDSFSIHQPNYKWTKTYKKEEWYKILKNDFNVPISDTFDFSLLKHTPEERVLYLGDSSLNISLKELRYALRLRSTNFQVFEKGEEVILKGKGFGHGVGLAQEGAMNMAQQGYSYSTILHFYYQDIFLIKKNALAILKDYYDQSSY